MLAPLPAKEGRENHSEDVSAGLKPSWRLASIVIASLATIPDCHKQDGVGLLPKAILTGRFCCIQNEPSSSLSLYFSQISTVSAKKVHFIGNSLNAIFNLCVLSPIL